MTSRGYIQTLEDLYQIQKGNEETKALSAMTIGELHKLYRQWPVRHEERLKEGREHMTYYFEGLIVRELQSRKPTTKEEQLKIDYCVATYNNELDNMSFIFSCPVKVDDNKIYPDTTKTYSPDELAALITRYSHYRDVAEREILIEYVDLALDMLGNECYKHNSQRLAFEIAELGRRKVLRVPEWVIEKK